jgi:DNA-binding HxlR family transcriptional regulator
MALGPGNGEKDNAHHDRMDDIAVKSEQLLILWQLLRRPCRFNELRRAITGVSQHMLTVQLRDLESQGVITRTIFAEVPPRVEYALSEHGKSLGGVMRALAEWRKSHLARPHG